MKRIVVGVAMLMSVAAVAQTKSEAPKPVRVQRVDISGGGEIEGNRLVSGAGWIAPKAKPMFPNLIKVRGSFTPELASSVDNL